MAIVIVLLIVYLCCSLAYWLAILYGVVRLRQRVGQLGRMELVEPQLWPRLSVVVPACNEADKIEAAALTLLGQDYPDLEIVLVDDRSTDGTGQIIDRLAGQDQRAKAVHISRLPEGWMGKVHALKRGLAESNGEFVLFTDADVHFRQGTLRKSVSYCLEHKLDHLAGLPNLWATNILLDSALMLFLRSFLVFIGRAWAVGQPNSRSYLGVGAFNLVRRSAMEATEGFDWLRQEVADDMGLGLLMKSSWARCGAVAAFGWVSLHWYRTIREAAIGGEKGYATLCGFSLGRTLVMALGTLLAELGPILLLVPLWFGPTRLIGYGGIGVLALSVLANVLLIRWVGSGIALLLASPAAAVLLTGVLIRAGIVGWRRGGLAWRESFYTPGTIDKARKVRFPWLAKIKAGSGGS